MIPWTIITRVGDFTVTATASWLLASRARPLALYWCLFFLAGMCLVVVSKIAFIGWGVGSRSFDFTGFSGHATSATAVLPVMLFLLVPPKRPLAQKAGVAVGIACGVLVGISRVMLEAHSVSEVVAGCGVGATVSLGVIRLLSMAKKPSLNRPMAAYSVAALLTVPVIGPAPTHLWVIDVALFLSGHERSVDRPTSTRDRCANETSRWQASCRSSVSRPVGKPENFFATVS